MIWRSKFTGFLFWSFADLHFKAHYGNGAPMCASVYACTPSSVNPGTAEARTFGECDVHHMLTFHTHRSPSKGATAT